MDLYHISLTAANVIDLSSGSSYLYLSYIYPIGCSTDLETDPSVLVDHVKGLLVDILHDGR